MRTIRSDEIIALSHAVDAATDCGDLEEAIRLASMPWEEVRRWLDAQGYPGEAATMSKGQGAGPLNPRARCGDA